MSVDSKCHLSIVDMLLNDASALDDFEKTAGTVADEDADVSNYSPLDYHVSRGAVSAVKMRRGHSCPYAVRYYVNLILFIFSHS